MHSRELLNRECPVSAGASSGRSRWRSVRQVDKVSRREFLGGLVLIVLGLALFYLSIYYLPSPHRPGLVEVYVPNGTVVSAE